MTTYTVIWTIDLEAETPEAAAAQALEIHRDPESLATFFVVREAGTGDALVEA